MLELGEGNRVAKFACPHVLDAQKLSEDNQYMRSGCPPDYHQIFLGKYFENSCPYTFFEVFILTLSFSNKHISFWELKTNRIVYGIQMRATKNMSRTTRFSILKIVVHTHSLRFLFSPFPFPTNIYHFGNLKQIA